MGRTDCVPKCWGNSKYVSTCDNEVRCLCQDSHFQSVSVATRFVDFELIVLLTILQVVLQCLYSQCQTTQFGSAIHHALSECSDDGLDTFNFLPPLIRHQGLRKRASLDAVYATASASATHSVSRRYASVSAGSNPHPTRSAAYGPTPTPTVSYFTPTTLTSALSVASTNGTVLRHL